MTCVSDSVNKAMIQDKEREEAAEKLLQTDERKRSYNSMKAEGGALPTDEEMEAYHRRKRRNNDPMADFFK